MIHTLFRFLPELKAFIPNFLSNISSWMSQRDLMLSMSKVLFQPVFLSILVTLAPNLRDILNGSFSLTTLSAFICCIFPKTFSSLHLCCHSPSPRHHCLLSDCYNNLLSGCRGERSRFKIMCTLHCFLLMSTQEDYIPQPSLQVQLGAMEFCLARGTHSDKWLLTLAL